MYEVATRVQSLEVIKLTYKRIGSLLDVALVHFQAATHSTATGGWCIALPAVAVAREVLREVAMRSCQVVGLRIAIFRSYSEF